MKFFVHFDANKFYASCERITRAELNEKPVIVLSNNDGCGICTTKEAQKLGFKMGTKLFEEPWKSIVKQNDITVFSTNFPLYGGLSKRFKRKIGRQVGMLEDYSCDEEFGQEDGVPVDVVVAKCHEVIDGIQLGLHLPVSCGIAPTKTLAKVATGFAKKYKGYRGVCAISTEEQIHKALRLVPIGDVWGIGRQHAKRLKSMGIETAWDFAFGGIVNEAWVLKYMTKVGLKTWLELQGISRIDLETVAPPKKNIMISRSFGRNINSFDALCSAMSTYVQMNAAKLRKQGSKARTLHVAIQTNVFRDDHEQDFPWIKVPLPVATSSNIEMNEYMRLVLRAVYRKDLWYKKGYIMSSDIVPEDEVDGNLFDTRDRAKEDRLMVAWDYLTGKYGPNILRTGAQGIGSFDWWVRQEKLSPNWLNRPKEYIRCVDYPAPAPTGEPEPLWAESNGYGYFTTTTKPLTEGAA